MPTPHQHTVCVCTGGGDAMGDVIIWGGGKRLRRDSGGLLMRRVGGWARDARGGRARLPRWNMRACMHLCIVSLTLQLGSCACVFVCVCGCVCDYR